MNFIQGRRLWQTKLAMKTNEQGRFLICSPR
ncbi:hypothetical protein YPS_4828 (plasmid) [Yersinia pestis Pestoides A]|nr:hypothetical protein YPS_4828 [Yersinia pestis Pestoides A]